MKSELFPTVRLRMRNGEEKNRKRGTIMNVIKYVLSTDS